MKKPAIAGFLAILAVILVFGNLSAQPMGPGRGGGYCPWMGGGSPDQQRGWYCPWMSSQTGPPVAKSGQPLSADQAKVLVEQHISGNPNLKAGKVSERNGTYEVEVVTKEGSMVDKIQVNKQTGWFRSAR